MLDFSDKCFSFSYFSLILHKNIFIIMSSFILSNSYISLEISSLWAELQSLRKWETEYLYQKIPWFWQRQSPVLFPIVWALKDGRYFSNEKEYSLSQHGFARDKEFLHTSEVMGESITFSLFSDLSTCMKYPFDFQLSITYILIQDSLRVEYTVKNTGISEMFFSLGGHPAFSLLGDISHYSLRFLGDTELCTDRLTWWLIAWENEVIDLKDKILPLSDSLFIEDALILRSLQSPQIELYKNREQILSFDRGNFPHFAIWKQVWSPFLCLEPWQGYADLSDSGGKIEEKKGIVSLSGGEETSFWWSVKIY